MLVSFIIPAYNAADTIVRCLDSIYGLPLKQEDFEVIVIDDASTDNTVEIVEQYVQSLNSLIPSFVNSIQILHQPENYRQGAARNRGVKVAKSEYICFVDADDAVTDGIVYAIRMAKEKQTDMVAFHNASANEYGEIIREKEHLIFEQDEVFSGISLQNRHPYWFSGPVAYVYNRAFLKQVNYPFAEDVLFEDSDFVAVHLYHAKRMAYSKELGYIAHYREGSTTRHTSYKNVADYLLLGVRMLRFYERIKSEGMNELTNEQEQFAEEILEGACCNVVLSCKRIIKLSSIKEVRLFYDRVDEIVDRKEICDKHNLQKYYWNGWTSLCTRHKRIAIAILAILIPMRRILKGCKMYGGKWKVERVQSLRL